MHDIADAAVAARAEELAERLVRRAAELETPADRRRRRLVGRVVASPQGRDFLIDLTDQVLRVPSPSKAAVLLRRLVEDYPVTAILGPFNGAAFRLAAAAAPLAPWAVVPAVRERLRRELSDLVLPAERRPLAAYIAKRRAEGTDLNVNLLGEAVLGEEEALGRTERVCELLRRPEVTYVSVKISSICAQLDVLAYEHSLGRICERLRTVLGEAVRHRPAKFVNLDMEEYRDLELTLEAFMKVLSEPSFAAIDAGVVLQAYLPDSHPALERLCQWAKQRHQEHGSSIKVRLVKGANLAMEAVEAELRGWPQAPYPYKELVDASFKRLVASALRPANAGALRVGVASHNLFDVGWALAWRERHPGGPEMVIEMLQGMANPQAQAVRELAGGLLLYTPVVPRHDFSSAVAYLVRRFDENTSPDNFLAHLFDLEPGSLSWDDQRSQFRASLTSGAGLDLAPRRRQDRAGAELRAQGQATVATARMAFENAPDTDFTRAENRRWALRHLGQWRSWAPEAVPALVAGHSCEAPLSGVGHSPSHPEQPLYRYVEADEALMRQAVSTAVAAAGPWSARPAEERRDILWAVADVMERQRGKAIATMVHDAGKVVAEADTEVSEAVDFARYYGQQQLALGTVGGGVFTPYRAVVVAPPWNFPYAIPAGGALAALAAGAAVVLKPAPESVLVAWLLVRQCHEAGVPPEVLQFLPCADGDVGRALVTHPDVDAVVLTGSFETARRFLGWRPALNLHAETSGKNALVVSAAADVDDAIADLVRSAFSHSGQKCSAASLALVEAELYDDPRFLRRLAGAVKSLRVGPADDLATQVGPLIRPPDERLGRFLTQLVPGESWLVRPQQVGANPQLWRPGVKLGVAPGSVLHREEVFGPVLGVMRYRGLEEALALQNAPVFGLTAGAHSLDDRETQRWSEQVEAGNAYVNRHTTGAVVRRQPFGGWKRSCAGHRAKAGGPLYVASMGTWAPAGPPRHAEELARAARLWPLLAAGHDPTGLRAEANIWRLRAVPAVVLRLEAPVDDADLAFSLGVAAVTGAQAELSVPERSWAGGRQAVVESAQAFLARVAKAPPPRARYLGPAGADLLRLVDAVPEVVTGPVVVLAEREILCWAREQALSWSLHRHGNVRSHALPLTLTNRVATNG